jgi:argininosuccinate synthase
MHERKIDGRIEPVRKTKRMIVAYSGGFETSLAIPRLARDSGAEIVTVTVDVGQGGDLANVRERALSLGAVRAHVIDARDEFIHDFILPSLQAGALQDGVYPLSHAMVQALVARRLVQVARMEEASAIVHGALPGNRIHLEVPLEALDPAIERIAAHQLTAVDDATLDQAKGWGIPTPSATWRDRIGVNLWERWLDVGPIASPGGRLPEEMFALTRAAQDSPDDPAYVDVDFESGTPVRINGIEMPLLDMIESLETIAGSHGVGRLQRIVQLPDGPSLELHEAPAAVVLHAAHVALETRAIGHAAAQQKRTLSRTYADLIANGNWFAAARRELDAVLRERQPQVTGGVRLTLFKGDSLVVSGQLSLNVDEGLRRRATVG